MVVFRVYKGLPFAQNRAHVKGLLLPCTAREIHSKEAFCRVPGLAHGKSEILPCAILLCRMSKVQQTAKCLKNFDSTLPTFFYYPRIVHGSPR